MKKIFVSVYFDMMSGAKNPDWNAKFMKDVKIAEEAQAEAEKNKNIPNVPGLPLKAYTGEYSSPIYGDLMVSADKKSLTITLGTTRQFTVKVAHETMNSFVGDWSAMDPADPEYHFDFAVDTEGDVTAVTLREFNQDGTLTFIRQ